MSTLIVSVLLAFVSSSTGQATSSDYILYSLAPLLNNVTLWDGPSIISQAPSKSSNPLPTPDQIQYYDYFAASMYNSLSEIQNLTCQYCQYFNSNVSSNKVVTNDTTNTVGMITVTQDKQEIVVSFRGTYNLINFVLDQTLVQVDVTKNISLHAGFYIATMSLYKQVVSELQTQLELNPGIKKVVITGHSLGGSMASLTQFFLVYLKEFPGVSYTLVTFGQPRTGNKGYADYMKSLTIPMVRVTNRADLFVHIVPVSIAGTSLVFGDYFYHHQTEYWVNGTGSYCSQTVYEDPTCSDSLGPLYTPVDHLQYLNCNYVASAAQNPFAAAAIPILLDPAKSPLFPTFNSSEASNGATAFYNLVYPSFG